MSIMGLMLPLILGTGLALLAALVWAIRNGQFEDVEDEKHRIFFEKCTHGGSGLIHSFAQYPAQNSQRT